MKQVWFAFGSLALLAVLLGGCVTRGYAGQENATATVGGQAGETPSTPEGTPQSGQTGTWERHRFFDVWDVGYPSGWTVDRPGNAQVILSGAFGGRQYKVDVSRPMDVQAKDLPSWVQSDLEQINQGGAPRQEASIKDIPAMKVTNVNVPGQAQGACPAVRLYARTEKLKGEQNYLIMTVTQADNEACDAVNLERLSDALVAEVRS